MTQKQSEAQQNRRARERGESNAGKQAALAANAAAARLTDQQPAEFQADPEMSQDAFAPRTEDAPPREIKRGNPVRTAAYEEIMAKRQSEQADAVHESPRDENDSVQEPAATQIEPSSEQPQTEASPIETQLVRVKVDGEEFDVPQDEIEAAGGVAAYRINKAAENRLAKAKQELDQQRQQLQQQMALLQQQLRPPEPARKPLPELIKEKVQQIQFGTQDEAAAAIQEILDANSPQIDPQRIEQQTIHKVFEHMAAQQFVARTKDLTTNPVFADLAILTQNRMIAAQGQPRDWGKFYSDLETNLRSVLGKPSQAIQTTATPTSQPPSGTVADKEARKASIVALPSAAATRAVAPEAEKPLTRDELLARARKARGQPI